MGHRRIFVKIGDRFGRLVVVGYAPPRANAYDRRVHARCSCKGRITVSVYSLTSGNTASCGCLKRETTARLSTKHGSAGRGRKTPEYRAWVQLRSRCNNPHVSNYHNYGGRGIKVCRRWATFDNFLADMGSKPTPKHSVERRNNNRGYSPSNCYWGTRADQSRNRRGVKLTVAKARAVRAAKAAGEHYRSIAKRFKIAPATVWPVARSQTWKE